MDTNEIERELKRALDATVAKYEISKSRAALVLSINDGSDLISLMDKVFALGMSSLAPLDSGRKVEPTPSFKIDHYSVSPTFRKKRIRKGMHEYDFIYEAK